LHRVENACFCSRDVTREIAQEGGLAELAPIGGPDDAGGRRRGGETLGERGIILAGVGGACRDIDQGHDLWIDPCLGDDHAGEGVSDQNGRAILQIERALRGGDAGVQGGEWILHRCGIQAGCLKPRNHLRPGRAVREQPVHEDDIARLACGLRPRCRLKDGGSHGGGGHEADGGTTVHV
jgi:hypothetical protein